MSLTDNNLEESEKKYFKEIKDILSSNKQAIIDGYNSKEDIKVDWQGKHIQRNDIAIGAQRVVMSVICRNINWIINSAPLSSDTMFETDDCIINMDSKTMLETDSDVNLNRIQVRKNQISYGRGLRYKGQKGKRKGQNLTWNPALPNYYHHSKKGEIPCLSFFVEFIYDNKSNLKEINLISVPNGQLITHYGNILEPPKSFPLTGQEPPSMRVMIDKIKTPLLTKGWERKEQIYP